MTAKQAPNKHEAQATNFLYLIIETELALDR